MYNFWGHVDRRAVVRYQVDLGSVPVAKGPETTRPQSRLGDRGLWTNIDGLVEETRVLNPGRRDTDSLSQQWPPVKESLCVHERMRPGRGLW